MWSRGPNPLTTTRARSTAPPRRGKTGWIGQKIVAMLRAKGADVVVAETRLEHIQDVRARGGMRRPAALRPPGVRASAHRLGVSTPA